MRAIRTGLNGAGIPVENSKGEASAGQEEINVRYAEALDVGRRPRDRQERGEGDRLVQGQGGHLHGEVRQRAAGSSSHLHQSLRTLDGKPAFFDPGAPHGMSKADADWVAGLLDARRRRRRYFLAPYVNSYKRFVAGTFAPTKAVWSTDNRTAGYRLVGDGHARRSASSAGSAAPTSTPTSPTRRRSPPASTGSSASWSSEPEFRGDAYAARRMPRDPEDAARRHRGAAPARRCCARRLATRWSSTICTPRAGSRPSATAA